LKEPLSHRWGGGEVARRIGEASKRKGNKKERRSVDGIKHPDGSRDIKSKLISGGPSVAGVNPRRGRISNADRRIPREIVWHGGVDDRGGRTKGR